MRGSRCSARQCRREGETPRRSLSGSSITAANYNDIPRGLLAVTEANPAKRSEVLIAQATGLGPTRPGVDPGQPFPLDATQDINSPLDVTINGQPAEVINKIGWPGLVDTYRVDFRVPADSTPGQTVIQLSSAWIAGPAVSIPVQ